MLRNPATRRGKHKVHVKSLFLCTCAHFHNLHCPNKSHQILDHFSRNQQKRQKRVWLLLLFKLLRYLPRFCELCLEYWTEPKWKGSWWEQACSFYLQMARLCVWTMYANCYFSAEGKAQPWMSGSNSEMILNENKSCPIATHEKAT